jgi:hypothetical protein
MVFGRGGQLGQIENLFGVAKSYSRKLGKYCTNQYLSAKELLFYWLAAVSDGKGKRKNQ